MTSTEQQRVEEIAGANRLREALRTLLTRVQMEMRTGRLPVDWADPVILNARQALEENL